MVEFGVGVFLRGHLILPLSNDLQHMTWEIRKWKYGRANFLAWHGLDLEFFLSLYFSYLPRFLLSSISYLLFLLCCYLCYSCFALMGVIENIFYQRCCISDVGFAILPFPAVRHTASEPKYVVFGLIMC